MTRMTRPDRAVMCNLINTHTRTHEKKVKNGGNMRDAERTSRRRSGRPGSTLPARDCACRSKRSRTELSGTPGRRVQRPGT